MKTYRLTIARTITRVVDVEIEAYSVEEAEAKFERQLSDLSCPAIEGADWEESFGQSLDNPYNGEFELFEVEEI